MVIRGNTYGLWNHILCSAIFKISNGIPQTSVLHSGRGARVIVDPLLHSSLNNSPSQL